MLRGDSDKGSFLVSNLTESDAHTALPHTTHQLSQPPTSPARARSRSGYWGWGTLRAVAPICRKPRPLSHFRTTSTPPMSSSGNVTPKICRSRAVQRATPIPPPSCSAILCTTTMRPSSLGRHFSKNICVDIESVFRAKSKITVYSAAADALVFL